LGKKGKTGRLKRNPAPRFWPIPRKQFTWVIKPSSGPHSLKNCLPLSLVIRDILELAKTRKEAKKIITQGKVYVDGKVRRKDNFPVGLMDVISFPGINKFYRVVSSHKGLFISPIDAEEAKYKLYRVEDKTILKNKNIQFAFHDGSTILFKSEDSKNLPDVNYETFDVLKLNLPEKETVEKLKTKKGNFAIITGGKNIGKNGRIIEIEKTVAKKRRNALVMIEDDSNNRYQTIMDFIFVIGKTKSLISLPEATSSV
jgi:small subunit ribosomal protein S4e